MFRQDLKDKPSSLFVAFILVDSDYYPNIREIFHILLLTMPMGSVPCERSFSALRYLKQWNRTAIVQDRLNGPQGLDTTTPSTLKTKNKIVTSPCERTSIIAHSQRRKCWQGQNTRQIRLVNYFADIHSVMYRHKHLIKSLISVFVGSLLVNVTFEA